MQFGLGRYWKTWRLRNNKFAGALPGAVASWRSVRWIGLCSNKLSGVAFDLAMRLLGFVDVIAVFPPT